MATKNDIFQEFLKEYLANNRGGKGKILDHVTAVTKMHRKAVIRKFAAKQMKDPCEQEGRGRKTYYTPDVTSALKTLWQAANEPCGELLHPMIFEYVTILRRDGMWLDELRNPHSDATTIKLLAMSAETVRRRVSKFLKVRGKKRGISATRPSHLKAIIPIFKGPWRGLSPGHCQLDTVAHCGNTLLGDFIYSVNATESATYWLVLRAQWNKGQRATVESMKEMQRRLPIRWLGAHPDTGSEFINWVAKEWFDSENIDLTRSEPGKKNDNMYVEERNGHVVRKYLGYLRLDDPLLVPLVNEMYEVLADYLNHFQAVRRTIEKKRVGAKYVRKYEKIAKTPYQRMLEHSEVPVDTKQELRNKHEQLNPLLLKQQIDTLLTRMMKNRSMRMPPKR